MGSYHSGPCCANRHTTPAPLRPGHRRYRPLPALSAAEGSRRPWRELALSSPKGRLATPETQPALACDLVLSEFYCPASILAVIRPTLSTPEACAMSITLATS